MNYKEDNKTVIDYNEDEQVSQKTESYATYNQVSKLTFKQHT